VEEILHEGPLKPNHDGAFEIKKDYMDMSSSDDETPAKKHDDLYFKTSEEKKVKPKSPPKDPRFDPNSRENQ
jgi:hypothetical protein